MSRQGPDETLAQTRGRLFTGSLGPCPGPGSVGVSLPKPTAGEGRDRTELPNPRGPPTVLLGPSTPRSVSEARPTSTPIVCLDPSPGPVPMSSFYPNRPPSPTPPLVLSRCPIPNVSGLCPHSRRGLSSSADPGRTGGSLTLTYPPRHGSLRSRTPTVSNSKGPFRVGGRV